MLHWGGDRVCSRGPEGKGRTFDRVYSRSMTSRPTLNEGLLGKHIWLYDALRILGPGLT